MPCDKATYRTHRTKPTPKPANGAALRIMPLRGRMSSSQREFRKRSLQLTGWEQTLRAAQCAATGNAAKKDNQPKTFGAPRPTRGRPQCDAFTRSLRTLWTLLCRYRGSGACRCQPGRPSTQLQQRAQQNERGVGQITNEERSDAGFRMTVQGQNLDEATFARMVGDAEKGCPVSRVLNAAITLDAKLT
jgi:hypothetical protein